MTRQAAAGSARAGGCRLFSARCTREGHALQRKGMAFLCQSALSAISMASPSTYSSFQHTWSLSRYSFWTFAQVE